MMHRAIHSPGPRLTAPDGEPTNGTYIFTRMLMKLVRQRQPRGIIFCLDSFHSVRRDWFPAYKSNRQKKGAEVGIQFRRMVEITKAMGVPVVRRKGWEADDLIASYARQLVQHQVVFLSRDKDLHQVIGPRVRCYDPMTREWVEEHHVWGRWGVGPDRVVDVQTLAGDTTDCIPGVRGIGRKRAVALVQQYENLEGVLANVEHLTPAMRRNIQATNLDLMRRLVTLRTDLSVPMSAVRRFRGLWIEHARPIFEQLGFRRFTNTKGGRL